MTSPEVMGLFAFSGLVAIGTAFDDAGYKAEHNHHLAAKTSVSFRAVQGVGTVSGISAAFEAAGVIFVAEDGKGPRVQPR